MLQALQQGALQVTAVIGQLEQSHFASLHSAGRDGCCGFTPSC